MGGASKHVVIRHLSGSKINQIEQLPLSDQREFVIGRDPASEITFDPIHDSVVSRRHAAIQVDGGATISFSSSSI
jgi:serine protease Do